MRTEEIPEVVRVQMLSFHPCPSFIFDEKGGLHWSNREFQDEVEYSSEELGPATTWMYLSVPGLELDANIRRVAALTDDDANCVMQKQLRPKNSAPKNGKMFVNRVKLKEQVLYWAVWERFRENTGPAFELAISHIKNSTTEIGAMRVILEQQTSQNQDEMFVVTAMRAAQRHPWLLKAAVAAILAAGGSTALASLMEVAQKLGIVDPSPVAAPADQPPQVKVADPIDPTEHLVGKN